ncbi:MAG: SDR family oxidoreductase [Candidatus Omnitrophica bacterium]|nr:SDR family oxidoreductase [Candidatus Omnitrophota bacterium]
MANYCVTGGAGFIGSHIVDELVLRGEFVRVLDNFETGKKENLSSVLDKIELVEEDIRNFEVCKKITIGIDYVLHQAALRSVPKSMFDPISYNEVNVKGTLNILMAAQENKVKRVVFASSSSVYGDTAKLPEKETDPPNPISIYALTKLMGEYYCKMFTSSFGLETVVLRYFNVFGPRQSLESQYAVVIPKFVTCMLKNESPPIHGDGMQSRDFTYVKNVVDVNLIAATSKNSAGEIFNIACGKSNTILELVNQLNKMLKKDMEPVFTPPRHGDVIHTLADISKAKNILGFNPIIDFEEGLGRTIDYFKKVNAKK